MLQKPGVNWDVSKPIKPNPAIICQPSTNTFWTLPTSSGCKKLEAVRRKSSKHPFRVDMCVSFQVDIYPIELIGKDMCSLQMGDSTTERCFFGGFTSMLLFMKRRERQVERIRHSFSPHKQKKVWKDSKVKPSTIKKLLMIDISQMAIRFYTLVNCKLNIVMEHRPPIFSGLFPIKVRWSFQHHYVSLLWICEENIYYSFGTWLCCYTQSCGLLFIYRAGKKLDSENPIGEYPKMFKTAKKILFS